MEWYRHLIELRNNHGVLKTGECQPLNSPPEVMAFIRNVSEDRDVFNVQCENNTALVIFNRSGSSSELEVDAAKLRPRLIDAFNYEVLAACSWEVPV